MFSSALPDALTANGAELSVVPVADGPPSSSSRVVGELVNGSTTSIAKSAEIEHQKSVRVPMNNRQLSATIRHPDNLRAAPNRHLETQSTARPGE